MKTYRILVVFLLMAPALLAQDALTTELFSADNIMKYQAEIELTDAQIKEIQSIYSEGNTEFSSVKWKLAAEQSKLDKIIRQPKVDQKAALAQMKLVTALEAEAKQARLKTLVQIKNVLSPGQQIILKNTITDQDRKGFFISTDISDERRVKLQVSGALNQGEKPLYILKEKGKNTELTQAQMQVIDPHKIESITVLKGESALKAYGKRGEKNGVIEIILKNKNKI